MCVCVCQHYQKLLQRAPASLPPVMLGPPALLLSYAVMRFSSTAYPGMGTITVTGAEGMDGILAAISEFVLALHRREVILFFVAAPP